jgi:ATP-dependent Clp protease ATP-binding subunit ClpC
VFERWTDDARRALAIAQERAHEAGQRYIGLDHLLIGVIEVDDADVDLALGGRAAAVREAAVRGLKRARRPTTGDLPVLPVLADLMEKARKESEREELPLGPAHLLRALAGSGQRAVTGPLRAASVSVDAVTTEPEPPVPQDIAIPAAIEALRDEVALLRAEVDELRRRLDTPPTSR